MRLSRVSAVSSLVALVALCAPSARAATTGSIQGIVTDRATGKPLGGVSVVASGAQGEQTEFTDSAGRYLISDIAPGEYVVRFYFGNVNVERPGVVVQADQTLSVSAAVPTASMAKLTYR